jgi:hypothetical protein
MSKGQAQGIVLHVAVLTMLLAGCQTAEVMPHYSGVVVPRFARIPDAQHVSVTVWVRDERTVRDPELIDALRDGVENGLSARGFGLASDGVVVELAIEHVYHDMKPGVWSVSESAELIARCRVGRFGERVQLDKQLTAKSPLQKVGARPTAEEVAYRNLLAQLLNDSELTDTLVRNRQTLPPDDRKEQGQARQEEISR